MRNRFARLASFANALIYAMLVVAVVGGCSSSERKINDLVVAPASSDNPAEQFTALENGLSRARERNVHLLSPTW